MGVRPTLHGRRKQQTRGEIIRAAFELFGQHGYEDVSMDSVAEAAGVSRATLFNYFPQKELILREIAAARVAKLKAILEEFAASGKKARYDDIVELMVRLTVENARISGGSKKLLMETIFRQASQGVLLVARPGFGGLHPAALLSFGSAICYALYVISTRLLARTDSSETTLFYSNLVGALAMLPVVPFVWTTPGSVFIVALMVLIGAFGSFGHYLLIRGHRLAPASALAPFIYTQLVWTTTLGFLVFGDIPHHWTIAGGLIVVSSGLYLLNRERKVGTVTPTTPVA